MKPETTCFVHLLYLVSVGVPGNRETHKKYLLNEQLVNDKRINDQMHTWMMYLEEKKS